VNAPSSARGTAAAAPRVQKCSCDGGGWIVTLDRDRYKAPATSGMVRFTRCICLDYAPSPVRSGGAGAGLATALVSSGAASTAVLGDAQLVAE
jgi:hypothetical protein